MNQHIYESLLDIEHRVQTILDDIRCVKEQAFYTYYPADANNEDSLGECSSDVSRTTNTTN